VLVLLLVFLPLLVFKRDGLKVAGGLRIERSRGRLRPLPEGGHIDGCR